MGWKESKRAQGFKDMLVWLEPAAVEALERLKSASLGSSVADLVSKAVILAAGMEPPEVAGHVAGPDPEVASLKGRLAAVGGGGSMMRWPRGRDEGRRDRR